MNDFVKKYIKRMDEKAKYVKMKGVFPKASFTHSSMYGSYPCDCEVLKHGTKKSVIRYIDPWSEEISSQTIATEDLTMKKIKSKVENHKDDGMTTMTISIDRDLYFKVLQACIDRQETIDEFFAAAIKNIVDRYKEAKKDPAKMKALKADIEKAKKV